MKTQRLVFLSPENANVRKDCIFHDSNYMTFWKRQNYGHRKKISGCQGLEGMGKGKDN